ncbi:single-stranded DNA-binding protein [Deinococcus xinjiangensis]|uniref:Single-stranded DNA-binding protein n=1 Tax=Deinococcus xinjiangensis TaxID=457454 RepID=A0ABP9VBG7_9DEIO
MLNLNRITLIGRLAQDLELRYTPSGLAVVSGTLHGLDQVCVAGQSKEVAWYHRFEAYGPVADYALSLPSTGAGLALALDATLDYQEWQSEAGKGHALKIKALQLAPLDVAGDEVLGLNQGSFSGFTGQAARVRQTREGPALDLRLAVTDRWVNKQGQTQSKTHWLPVVLPPSLAGRFDEVPAGTPLLIQGRLFNDKVGEQRVLKVLASQAEWLSKVRAVSQQAAD